VLDLVLGGEDGMSGWRHGIFILRAFGFDEKFLWGKKERMEGWRDGGMDDR
jgi:hypothetical protein